MAIIKIHLDTRTVRKDGTSPLKMSVFHKGKTVMIGLNAYVPIQNWDETNSKITGLPNRATLNAYLFQKRVDAENIVLNLASAGLLDSMGAPQLKDAILGKGANKADKNGFSCAFRRFIAQKSNPGTIGLYEQTLSKLYSFCPELDGLKYEDITKGWLSGFDAFLAKTSPSRNVRNIHLRNIRAVFNYAIDKEYTTVYPFRRFKIKAEETRKRSLSVEQLRILCDYPCEEYQAKYRDIFMLKPLLSYNNMIFTDVGVHDVIALCSPLPWRCTAEFFLPSSTTCFSAIVSRNFLPCSIRHRPISSGSTALINRSNVSEGLQSGQSASSPKSLDLLKGELTHINVILATAYIRQQCDCKKVRKCIGL